MIECEIEIMAVNDQLILTVGTPTEEKIIERPIPAIDPGAMNELRGGAAKSSVVADVTRQLSEWLSTPDLDLPLLLELKKANSEPLRLVYNVRKVEDENIRAKLTDLPFELIAPMNNLDSPLVMHKRIASVVHVLPKASSPAVIGDRSWPLRVLIVRANPRELQQIGQVPSAIEIRDAIRGLDKTLGRDLLQIDVLSREDDPDIAGLPTKEMLLNQIEDGYDILVFLGHGEVRQAHIDEFPIGMLQLETEDGERFDPIDASKLSKMMIDFPVPVVLLVGCLTAAEGLTEKQLEAITKEHIPSWMRGSRAVAQGLIDGQSGVQFVVGMRYRITDSAAKRFLKAFFRSLLVAKTKGDNADEVTAGDLERAVRRARRELATLEDDALSWAAPLIFRTRGDEPTFPFLATPRKHACETLSQEKIRPDFWKILAKLPWAMHSDDPESLYAGIMQTLADNKQELIALRTADGGALVTPVLTEVPPEAIKTSPEETIVRVPIELHGTLTANLLEGTLSVAGDGTSRILPLDPATTGTLKSAGWRISNDPPEGNRMVFTIRRPDDNPAALPAGLLFAVDVSIPPTPSRVHTVTLDQITSRPAHTVCGGSNAIIVSM
jgi:hypothetical protein